MEQCGGQPAGLSDYDMRGDLPPHTRRRDVQPLDRHQAPGPSPLSARCSPPIAAPDTPHEQALRAFVETQYRRSDGVWLQAVPPGYGVQWRTNAAHPSTGRFTLAHADAGRTSYGDGREVVASWLLGDAPCTAKGPLANRICVKVRSASPQCTLK